MIIDELIFEPVQSYMSGGNELQVAKTNYLGIDIIERSFFPYNIFKNMTVYFIVDLVLPLGTIPNLSDNYYTDEGFGVPECDTLEEAIQIIDDFKSGKYETRAV